MILFLLIEPNITKYRSNHQNRAAKYPLLFSYRTGMPHSFLKLFNSLKRGCFFDFYDICRIAAFKKYLFANLVIIYVITAAGIPVYAHYCGGELESINYLVKGSSCCGEEEEESSKDCCKDENHILKSSVDFTYKSFGQHILIKAVNDLLITTLFYPVHSTEVTNDCYLANNIPLPPKLQSGALIATSVIRI